MRTTIVLRDEAYEFAREQAFVNQKSLGETISDLILKRPSMPTNRIRVNANGLPVFSSNIPLTVESVKRMLDEDDA